MKKFTRELQGRLLQVAATKLVLTLVNLEALAQWMSIRELRDVLGVSLESF